MAMLVVLTLMTGLLYVGAGVLRLGFVANFLSIPILTGYLNGIALMIVLGQMKGLLGYSGTEREFFLQLAELGEKLGQIHYPTAILGLALIVTLVLLRRWLPRIPGALVVVIIGIVAVVALDLTQDNVAVLGHVPAGLPTFHFAIFDLDTYRQIFADSAGLVLISFTSGVLTAKSFARRNRYEIDSNQELVAFGACNLASGLGQGFPVTGADSRTAVNDAMGGKSQLVGIVAGATMLLVLFFLTGPLANVPTAALAAVIIVSAIGLFDLASVRELFRTSRREFFMSVITTLGVLILGALPGVLLAVALSMLWLLSVAARPPDAVLGKAPGVKGFHNVEDYPEAKTLPGLLVYRFGGNVVFFNADYFKERLLAAVAASETPVEWVVLDASPISIVDATAMQKFDELRAELKARGIVLAVARARKQLDRYFAPEWVRQREELRASYVYPTVKRAVRAFEKRAEGTTAPTDADSGAEASETPQDAR
jgi:high affinity sulfate transporter 1